ncbi:MAG TPA: carboxypeptidase-like regulatory domain-containing protein [Verrucomicrobiae bacterium]|nr:carboxypeptidase-like regulatory domain-containing protein [Verrucomicrobiae bacterium]
MAQPTFNVGPSTVSNTYDGAITLQIGNLNGGATVVVQKFLDVNTDGVVDAGDLLVEQFDLTDGQPGMVVGGVTNFNVPGDLDGSANGQITAALVPNPEIAQHIVGSYLFKLSSASGAVTNSFIVTNFPFAQSLQGVVRSNETTVSVPYAVVVLFPPPRGGDHGPGSPVAATVANSIGNYSISVPPGTYIPVAFKDGFVANFSTAPTITTNSSGSLYLILTNATESISGQIVDINTGEGIPGLFNGNGSANGFIALSFTDTNGDFTEHVVPDYWQLDGEPQGLALHGYVGYNGKTNVDATGGSVSGLTLGFYKGNALFYGTVKDGNGEPLAGIDIYANDNFGEFQADSYTDANGHYTVVALGGVGGDTWQVQVSSDSAPANYIFSQPAFDQNGGTNLNAGQAAHVNFTGLLATNRITGNVRFNGTNVAGVGVSAYANIGGQDFNAFVDTDSNGNYTLNVGNSNIWSVSVNCNGGSDSLDGVLGPGNYTCPNNQDVSIASSDGTANFTVFPNGSGQIYGYVTNSSGGPVVGVAVYASDGVGIPDSTVTVGGGYYSFNVGNGYWDVSVDCGGLNSLGYQCVNSKTVGVSGGNVEQGFTVRPIVMPVLSSPVRKANQFSLWLAGASNQDYTLQMSTNLSATNWMTLYVTNNPATNSFLLNDPNATNQQRFYRVWVGQ